MTLGVDASTSVIGYTILNDDGTLYEIGYLNISKLGDFLDKSLFTYAYFNELLKGLKIDYVCIEDISKKFRPGFSSAQVITLLARFNGIMSHMLYHITKAKPTFLMSSQARKLAYNRSFPRGEDIKPLILKEVTRLENIVWFKNKRDKIRQECFDMADSYTMARAIYKIANK